MELMAKELYIHAVAGGTSLIAAANSIWLEDQEYWKEACTHPDLQEQCQSHFTILTAAIWIPLFSSTIVTHHALNKLLPPCDKKIRTIALPLLSGTISAFVNSLLFMAALKQKFDPSLPLLDWEANCLFIPTSVCTSLTITCLHLLMPS